MRVSFGTKFTTAMKAKVVKGQDARFRAEADSHSCFVIQEFGVLFQGPLAYQLQLK
jgi:hypothetical protein